MTISVHISSTKKSFKILHFLSSVSNFCYVILTEMGILKNKLDLNQIITERNSNFRKNKNIKQIISLNFTSKYPEL